MTIAKTQLVKDFLVINGWDTEQESGYPLLTGPEILDAPDQAVFITPSPGPGFVTEEAGLDNWGFQLRVRGPSDDPDTPEVMAQKLDDLIRTASYPQQVDGVSIQIASRSGATPSPLPLDPNDRRFEYTCTYLFVTQTGA